MTGSSRHFWWIIRPRHYPSKHTTAKPSSHHGATTKAPVASASDGRFIYVGLMLGGGAIIAMFVIACYMFAKKAERREMEATENGEANQDMTLPPPAYHEVMGGTTFGNSQPCDLAVTYTRSQSCNASPTRMGVDIDNLVRQLSEGSPNGQGLPALVDVTAFLAQHQAGHFGPGMHMSPLPWPHDGLENKLPTYEECATQNMEIPGSGSAPPSPRREINTIAECPSPQEAGSEGSGEQGSVENNSSEGHVNNGYVENENDNVTSPSMDAVSDNENRNDNSEVNENAQIMPESAVTNDNNDVIITSEAPRDSQPSVIPQEPANVGENTVGVDENSTTVTTTVEDVVINMPPTSDGT